MCDYYEDERHIVMHIDDLISAIEDNFDQYDLERIADDTEDYIYNEKHFGMGLNSEWQDKRNAIFKAIGSFARWMKEHRQKYPKSQEEEEEEGDEISTS